ncbi:class I SAM-dependent methyltransferase [Bacillus sp. SJS]|uniref:class I SAM-dependent methyltransferase n=1 Tax=Bacillus sp. SJS TaxID=1423321 RepID=UPI0004DD2AC1|nr:class I SAM-dependent methyltransferase [Bacillus sp. SJS]KZZ84712.1 methyltransferase [Bacillus sp. SJS]
MKETISGYEDILEMLDSFLREPVRFWDEFYSDREKGVPFFTEKPDENLVEYFERGLLQPGKVLELGCGPGRNAIFLAEKGCLTDAVDLSEASLQWAAERAQAKNLPINFTRENIFELSVEDHSYNMVYDSGCFHHIAPHRRMDYLQLVKRALKNGGHFGITCFVLGGEFGGADITDWEVYRQKSLMGGLGFTEEKLRTIFKDFEVVEMRRMRQIPQSAEVFGVSGLWSALFRKPL